MASNLGFRNKVRCLFKVPRLVCFVLIDPPFSNTQRRQCDYSSGSAAREKRATPLPGEEARDRGQTWQRTCTGLEVRWGGNILGPSCNVFLFSFYGGLAMIRRWCFTYIQSVVRLSFPSIISLKLKRPCASQMMVVTV